MDGEDSNTGEPTPGPALREPRRGGVMLRYRDFGPLRWIAFLLMIGGLSSCGALRMWSPAFWVSAGAVVVGFVLLQVDNTRRVRKRD